MVAVSLRERQEVVREFAEDFGFGFPVWVDPGGESPAGFGVPGHPSTLLIDPAGRIVARVIGERDWRRPEARRLVEWLLEQRGR
jgi:hypothetical protein